MKYAYEYRVVFGSNGFVSSEDVVKWPGLTALIARTDFGVLFWTRLELHHGGKRTSEIGKEISILEKS